MPSDELSDQPFYPHAGCDSGKFSPQKRAYYFALVSAETGLLLPQSSAETGLLLFSQNHRKPASSKGFQRPRARDKKLTTQEVKNIQVVEASRPVENSAILLCGGDPHTPLQGSSALTGFNCFNVSTPQTARAAPSERKSSRFYDAGEGRRLAFSLATRSRSGVFMAEECLIEVVDAGVQGAYIGAHFLAERGHVLTEACDVSAHFLAKSGHVLADGGDCSPEAEANSHDRDDDGNGVRVHGGPDEQ